MKAISCMLECEKWKKANICSDRGPELLSDFSYKLIFAPTEFQFTAFVLSLGSLDFEESAKYIEHRFKRLNRNENDRQIYSHQTCATDTEQIAFVLDAAIDLTIAANMRHTALT